jgi:hypothetical protein
VKNADLSRLDFDSMTALAQQDPLEFERLRQLAIDGYINSVPAERRARLRRLQWRIDQERRNRTPLSACIRISKMMWEHFTGQHGLLNLFVDKPLTRVKTAKVIPIVREKPIQGSLR